MSRQPKRTPAKRNPLSSPEGSADGSLPTTTNWFARWRLRMICLGLTGLVLIVFGQTIGHEFLNCDDDVYVTDNPHVWPGITWAGVQWSFQNLQAGFWHPITWLSLLADAEIHGIHAGGFHLTNVVLHLANTVLLFFLLRTLTSSNWTSGVIAALFAVHPLHVESVAWISERKGLLSTLFFFLSLWAYVRYAQQQGGNDNPDANGGRSGTGLLGYYLMSLVFFTLALMSKTMVVTLPVILLLLDYWPLGRSSRSKLPKLILEKLPFFALSVAAGWLTVHAEKSIGALSQGAASPFVDRIGNALFSTGWYLWKAVWPRELAVFYPNTGSHPIGLVIGTGLALAAITAAVLFLARKRPYLVVGWFWYLVTLSPVSGLIPIGAHARADRYTYIPLIGIFLLVAWGIMEMCRSRRAWRIVFGGTAIVVLGALVVVAHAQTALWKDSVRIWSQALACAPEHFMSLNNLGNALSSKGRGDEAVAFYERALQLNPSSALVRANLGNKLAAEGKLDEAMTYFKEALELDPGSAMAHYNLGLALAVQGKAEEAIPHYEMALKLKPHYVEARVNLGNVLSRLGRLDNAIEQYEHALELRPGFAEVRYNLGNAFMKQGKPAEAIQQYEQVIRMKPDSLEAHNNFAIALTKQGKRAEAIQRFQQALNLATAQGKSAIAEDIRARIESYESLPPSDAP